MGPSWADALRARANTITDRNMNEKDIFTVRLLILRCGQRCLSLTADPLAAAISKIS